MIEPKWHFFQKWTTERGLAKDRSQWKVVMLEVAIESTQNTVTGETADLGMLALLPLDGVGSHEPRKGTCQQMEGNDGAAQSVTPANTSHSVNLRRHFTSKVPKTRCWKLIQT